MNVRQVLGLEPGQPPYRILIIEDNPNIRSLLFQLLDQAGFAVKEAENGQEAVSIHAEWHPHLIWMDIRMPEMDGYEVCKRLKSGHRLAAQASFRGLGDHRCPGPQTAGRQHGNR